LPANLTLEKGMFAIVMGVSSSGKSTIGKMLAERLGWAFYDGDDFHPLANIAKMSSGIPLNDEDRIGWLNELACLIRDRSTAGESGVIACSSLSKKHRDALRIFDRRLLRFFYLRGAYDVILERITKRSGHFMKAEMLKSQFEVLEEPWGIPTIDIALPQARIVDTIVELLLAPHYAVGIVGLGVMGRSLAQNFVRNCVSPIGYDKEPRLPDEFDVTVTNSLPELVDALAPPRTIIIMVPAAAVAGVVASLKPLLQKGDLIIDGGNSYFADTARRVQALESEGFHFIGMGVSGGEIGAIWGPSLMPGGSAAAWKRVESLFQTIAARADDGLPCVAWIGPGGAGHYVKMVHNGIEYGDMQLIAEIYDLLHRGAGISNAGLAEIFHRWNQGELRSYLIEITADILDRLDEETGWPLVNLILDEAAQQEQTGKWTSQTALDIGAAAPTINAAVESRLLSGIKPERVKAAEALGGTRPFEGNVNYLIDAAENALFAAKIVSLAQGMGLLRAASNEFGWRLDLGHINRIWRAGCVLRASLLDDVATAYDRDPELGNLLLDATFQKRLLAKQSDWREVVMTGIDLGIPMLAIGASLAYFDAYRSATLPANLTQAQRDYFGAHTYRRVDRDGSFHTEWVSKLITTPHRQTA
jgi:6-phosphogluconate dehydrogenase